MSKNTTESTLTERWRAVWPAALELWSRYTRLAEPLFCSDEQEEQRHGLTGSFAMIRLTDYRVIVSLRRITLSKLEDKALEILAHEVGHHVLAPANLTDNARLAARIKPGLPSCERFTSLVANLYTDLMINDRLQRSYGLDIASVYERLRADTEPTPLWTLYMRIYERLWSLASGRLVTGELTAAMEGDADLGARLVRAYSREWLDGAGRFACLCLPYLMKMKDAAAFAAMPPWFDTLGAGVSDELPDGLTTIDAEEVTGAIHPSEDPNLTGLRPDQSSSADHPSLDEAPPETIGGQKNNYRDPQEYVELMKGIGVKLDEKDIVARYYRERAIPYIIPFPCRECRYATDPLPEGLDPWEVSAPLQNVDWIETVIRSTEIIPGVTTVQRHFGQSQGAEPERQPVDLYLGVDCSGSMGNPAHHLSYPVLAGTIITLSALRAGARVMTCLSGEMPGRWSQTDGFSRNEMDNLRILTGYLGTGYSFGVGRLQQTFLEDKLAQRPTHILVVSDSDLFYMCKQLRHGWDICRDAAIAAGGGATACLELGSAQRHRADIDKLVDCGWTVHIVPDMSGVVAFARAFSKMKYDQQRPKER